MVPKTLSCDVGWVVQQGTHWAPNPPPKHGSGQGKRKEVEVPQGRKWPENIIQLLKECLFTALRTAGNAGNQKHSSGFGFSLSPCAPPCSSTGCSDSLTEQRIVSIIYSQGSSLSSTVLPEHITGYSTAKEEGHLSVPLQQQQG